MMSSTEANSFNQSILQQEQRAVPPAAGMPNGPRAQDMPRTTPIGTGSLAGAPAHPNDAAADLHSPQATASGSHADPAQGVGLGFDAGNPLGVSTEGLYASEPSGVAPRGGANEFEGVSARQRFEQLKVHDDSGKVVIIGSTSQPMPECWCKPLLRRTCGLQEQARTPCPARSPPNPAWLPVAHTGVQVIGTTADKTHYRRT